MNGTPLYCDSGCCGTQIMACDYGDKIVVEADHHGKDHTLTTYKLVDVGDGVGPATSRPRGRTCGAFFLQPWTEQLSILAYWLLLIAPWRFGRIGICLGRY